MLQYPDDYINHVICGDAFEVIKGIPDGVVDLVLTDPPYGINYRWKNYNIGRLNWRLEYDNIIGDDKFLDLSIIFQMKCAQIIFGGHYFYSELPPNGNWLCWDKRVDSKADKALGSQFELAWINKKFGYNKIYRVQHGGFVNSDGGKRFHPTQKPVKLFAKIIEDFSKPNDLILDPFLGSGTTAIAAQKLGRRFIGIEIDPKYCEIARKRLEFEKQIF